MIIPSIWESKKCSKPPTSSYSWEASNCWIDKGLSPQVSCRTWPHGHICFPLTWEVSKYVMGDMDGIGKTTNMIFCGALAFALPPCLSVEVKEYVLMLKNTSIGFYRRFAKLKAFNKVLEPSQNRIIVQNIIQLCCKTATALGEKTSCLHGQCATGCSHGCIHFGCSK